MLHLVLRLQMGGPERHHGAHRFQNAVLVVTIGGRESDLPTDREDCCQMSTPRTFRTACGYVACGGPASEQQPDGVQGFKGPDDPRGDEFSYERSCALATQSSGSPKRWRT